MKSSKIVMAAVIGVVPALTACSASGYDYEVEGYSEEVPSNGINLAALSFAEDCGSWSPYSTLFEGGEEDKEIYYCTGAGIDVFMYKGVYSLDVNKLKSSKYFQSKGEDKSDVHVTEMARAWGAELAYTGVDGYKLPMLENPLARYNTELDEQYAEGTLATDSDLESQSWEESDDGLLVGATGAVIAAGVMFASLAAYNNSAYAKSNGRDTSMIAVPKTFKSGETNLAYSNGSYYASKPITGSANVAVPKEEDKNSSSSPAGFITRASTLDSSGGKVSLGAKSSIGGAKGGVSSAGKGGGGS